MQTLETRSVGVMWGQGICMLSNFQVIRGQVVGGPHLAKHSVSSCCVSNAYGFRPMTLGSRVLECGLRSLPAWVLALWSQETLGGWPEASLPQWCHLLGGGCVNPYKGQSVPPALPRHLGFRFLQLFLDDMLCHLEHISPISNYVLNWIWRCLLHSILGGWKNGDRHLFNTTLWNIQSVLG